MKHSNSLENFKPKCRSLCRYNSKYPVHLPYCAHVICLDCLSDETQEFILSYNCYVCKNTVDPMFIKLHSKVYQKQAIKYFRKKVLKIHDRLIGIRFLVRYLN